MWKESPIGVYRRLAHREYDMHAYALLFVCLFIFLPPFPGLMLSTSVHEKLHLLSYSIERKAFTYDFVSAATLTKQILRLEF